MIETSRLVLRYFEMSDAPRVQELAGDKRVSDMTATIPYPYPLEIAEDWIRAHPENRTQNLGYAFAIEEKKSGQLVGCVGLAISEQHQRAEIGYWIGVPYWGHGYCTEAAREAARFGFGALKLQKITSQHLAINPASGKVMQKIGMKHEGTLRKHFCKNNELLDKEVYGLLREEFL